MNHKADAKDRQSRTGIYGAPKKGGAGGKGTWGKGGIDDLRETRIDPKDPDYNSEEEGEQVVLNKVDVITPMEYIIKEFLEEGDIEDAAKSIKEQNFSHSEFVKEAMIMSMEKEAFERENVSKLLSNLYFNVISPADIAEGFQQALDLIDDIHLDVPLADEMLAKFLSRAIVDEVIPPAFLNTASTKSSLAKETLALAHGFITDPHRSKKLEHIWGPGDFESVKRLEHEATTLIEEYLTSDDLAEAERCVRSLHAPSFHAKVVEIAIIIALQRNGEVSKKIYKFLSFISSQGTGLVAPVRITQGFKICKDSLNDIKLDAPNAVRLFEECVKAGQTEGWLTGFN
jgi:hypothetical protein